MLRRVVRIHRRVQRDGVAWQDGAAAPGARNGVLHDAVEAEHRPRIWAMEEQVLVFDPEDAAATGCMSALGGRLAAIKELEEGANRQVPEMPREKNR